MPILSINYTLRNKKPAAYEALFGAIKGASDGTYLHCLDSFWLIRSTASASEVFDHLAKFMKKNDSLVVMEAGADYKCFLPKAALDWIKDVLA